MIYIKLLGHDYRREVRDIIKSFYFGKKIEFSSTNVLTTVSDLEREDILIVNRLYKDKNRIVVRTIIRDIDGCISNEKEFINEEEMKKGLELEVETKNYIKRSIFRGISKVENYKLPWGILTGMRPMKKIYNYRKKGFSSSEIKDKFKNRYLIKTENIDLLFNIETIGKKYIYPLDERKYSLYINIPFCPSICSYCSFSSRVAREKLELEEYIEFVKIEIEGIASILRDKKLDTIYIGGGTPSVLSESQIEKIVNSIYKNISTSEVREFTIEAGRPDTLSLNKFRTYKELGINRISINPQTMNDDTLKRINRKHNSKQTIEAYEMARTVGFNSINMDLIVGLPGENIRHIEKTMREIEKLKPENLTLHTLSIKKSSKIEENIDKIEELNIEMESKKIESMLNVVKERSIEMNYKPYYMYRQKQMLGNFENIGYSTDMKECIYNIMIMEEKETIIGVGAGAVSKIYCAKKDSIKRVPNIKNIREYYSKISENIDRKAVFK